MSILIDDLLYITPAKCGSKWFQRICFKVAYQKQQLAMFCVLSEHKRQRKPKRQSRMDNQETLATPSTQDTGRRQTKQQQKTHSTQDDDKQSNNKKHIAHRTTTNKTTTKNTYDTGRRQTKQQQKTHSTQDDDKQSNDKKHI